MRGANIAISGLILPVLLLLSLSAAADTISRTVTGMTDGGQAVAFDVTIDFTQTGGDFSAGTGTAVVRFSIVNSSGLYPFQTPPMGNPIMTAFLFNIIPGATIAFTEARVLAGSSIYSTGTTMLGVTIPPGCYTLTEDEVHTGWYELQETQATGQYGIFTTSLETENGVKGGFVDPGVLAACVLQGDIFSPLVIAGTVQFTIELGNLDESLDSATDFLYLCSLTPGKQQAAALAGKFQGTDEYGEGSVYIADVGYCSIPTEFNSWGRIKVLYEE